MKKTALILATVFGGFMLTSTVSVTSVKGVSMNSCQATEVQANCHWSCERDGGTRVCQWVCDAR